MKQQTTWTLPSVTRTVPRHCLCSLWSIGIREFVLGICSVLNRVSFYSTMAVDGFTHASGETTSGASKESSESSTSANLGKATPARSTPTAADQSPPVKLQSSTLRPDPSGALPTEHTSIVVNTTTRSPSSSSLASALDGARPTEQQATSTVVKTKVFTKTLTTSRPPPSITGLTTIGDPASNTEGVVVIPPAVEPSTTDPLPSQPSVDPPPAAQTTSTSGRAEEHPPLTNGATAGIVLAVVAVLLGTFFLIRYIYKRRGFCGRGRPFSPIQEPYHRPDPESISRPYQQHHPGHPWTHHPGAQSYPSVVITPSREDIELQTFTRPSHGPRMYDVGHSGNVPLAPAYNGDAQGQEPQPPPGPDMPVLPESPNPSGVVQDGRVPPPNRAGAIPWEEGYRYRAW